MKITRLIHSCLLVENEGVNVLIDPGKFSYDSGLIDVDALPKLDYILITHTHDDHCSPKFIGQILHKSPAAKVIGNSEVASILNDFNIAVTAELPSWLKVDNLKHTKSWRDVPQIDNAVFTLWGKLTHFGDNQELAKVDCAETVTFSITAPWGSMADSIDRLIENPPKRVIPIHDWHLSEDGQDWYYQRIKSVLDGFGIEFAPVKPMGTIDI